MSSEEAVVIAEGAVDFEPDRVNVRYFQQGVRPRPYWAVSLQTLREDGNIDRVTVVLVDANTGEIGEIRSTD